MWWCRLVVGATRSGNSDSLLGALVMAAVKRLSRCRIVVRLGLWCCIAASPAKAQSDAVMWSGGVGGFVALNDLVSTSEVRARLQPTGVVSVAAAFGDAKLWRAHALIALFTGFRVTPEGSCDPVCAETSSRSGAVAYGTVERLLFPGGNSGLAFRTGVGIRALLFPSLGSNCDPRDTPCFTERDLSKRTYAPVLQVGVIRAIGNNWGIDLGASVYRAQGRTNVELQLMTERPFGW